MGLIVSIITVTIISPIILFASGNYDIVQTESMQRSNPLSIFSNKKTKKPSVRPKPNKILTRSVHLVPLPHINNKILYLTFDDGPNKGTDNVLKVLQEEDVRATMFFIGRNVEENYATYKRAKMTPNVFIANHTYSHANGRYQHFYSNADLVMNDIKRAQIIIGGDKYLRLAGRNVWRTSKLYKNDYAISKYRQSIEKATYDAVANMGYKIYGWDIEWNFNRKTRQPAYDALQMYSRLAMFTLYQKSTTDGHIVLLMHDYMFHKDYYRRQLKKFIHLLKGNGWKFATIDEYGEHEKWRETVEPIDF